MLSTEEIELVRRRCAELSEAELTAFSLAAVHRVLPGYQVYGEVHAEIRGPGSAHDALVAVSRLLRGQGSVTREKVMPKVDKALTDLESDLAKIAPGAVFGLAEAVAVEVATAVSLALKGWKDSSAEDQFQAAMGALEVDSVWAEGTADEVVSWDRLVAHHQQQVRDLEELRSVDRADASGTFRTIAYRAEREGMPYLNGMELLVNSDR